MYKVTFSYAAEEDLDEIMGYVAVVLADPQAVASLADKMAERYDDLSRTP